MIIAYPDVPPVEGPLAIPRPAVLLLGSYGGETDGWYNVAARYLDLYAGSVFYGILTGTWNPTFMDWYFHWLQQADLVVIWVFSGKWSEFEVGYVLGSGKKIVAGVGAHLLATRVAFSSVASSIGLDLNLHGDLPSVLGEAREAIRGMR